MKVLMGGSTPTYKTPYRIEHKTSEQPLCSMSQEIFILVFSGLQEDDSVPWNLILNCFQINSQGPTV